jgi:hypothetical protein
VGRVVTALAVLAAACSAGQPVAPPTTASDSTEPRPAICDEYAAGEVAGALGHPGLVETSGITFGASGTLWAHNDSGSEPLLYAVDHGGAPLGVIDVDGRNVDWEDVATGPGPGSGTYLYVADIGDNLGRRRHVTVYRFPEPDPGAGAVAVESLDVTYPNGPADAEALIVDGVTGDAFIVTKAPGWGFVYEIPASAWGMAEVEGRSVGAVVLPSADEVVTGGAVSGDGSLIALRTYGDIRLFPRDTGRSIGEALTHRSCFLATLDEAQGEAIAFDGDTIVTVGEGAGAPIHRYSRGG